MNYLIILLTSFLTIGASSSVHEFHVSKGMVEFKVEKSEVQISLNIFIDDLEIALKSKGIDSLYIGTEKEAIDADTSIEKYLSQVFQVEINQSGMGKSQFIGKEISEDLTSIWCYMRIPITEPIKELRVKNSILLETFEDQKNITSIVGPESAKSSFMSTRGDDEKIVSY